VASERQTTGLAVRAQWTVAMLSQAAPDSILRPSARSGFATELAVTRLPSPRDAPDDPLLLAGLQCHRPE